MTGDELEYLLLAAVGEYRQRLDGLFHIAHLFFFGILHSPVLQHERTYGFAVVRVQPYVVYLFPYALLVLGLAERAEKRQGDFLFLEVDSDRFAGGLPAGVVQDVVPDLEGDSERAAISAGGLEILPGSRC